MNLNARTKTVAENDVITTLKNIAETGVYGDEDVKVLMGYIVPICKNVFNKYMSNYRFRIDYDEDVLIDDILLKAQQIAAKYDSSKGNCFSYFYRIINNTLISKYRTFKSKPTMVSVDEPPEEEGPALGDLLPADESCEPGRKYVEQGARDDLFKRACEFASPLESLVLDLKANGLSISEIAEQLNKTPDQISKALYKCRKKLEEHRGMLL